MKKFLIVSMLLSSFLTWNCFGKFAITKKLHQFIDGINFEGQSSLLNKFVKSVVMWLCFIFPVAGLAFAADLIVINLIEFWTGDNIVDGSKSAKNSKTLSPGKNLSFESAEKGTKLTIAHSPDGETMTIRAEYNGELREIVAKKDEPGNLYLKEKESLVPVQAKLNETGDIDTIRVDDTLIPVL
ncbi:MAG: DUF3332 family protein [Leptospira sp.]|nr:DUF3332 family protein [Leptospira sp.]